MQNVTLQNDVLHNRSDASCRCGSLLDVTYIEGFADHTVTMSTFNNETVYATVHLELYDGMPAILELFSATHSGMGQEQFEAEVEEFFAKAKYPTLGVPVGQVVYQPMVELLDYLRANDFKTYICSGGGIDFMRVLSTRLYGIPPEQVIGTSMKKELHLVDGKWVLSRTGELDSFNDKEVKPVNIDLHIGTRPLLAMGNVRSSGDIGMLRYSQGRKGPSLQLLINHDDDMREFAYAEDDNASLSAAKANGWLVVSIKNDWKSVFRFNDK